VHALHRHDGQQRQAAGRPRSRIPAQQIANGPAVPGASKEPVGCAATLADAQGGTLSSRLMGSFSFNRALLSPVAGSSTPTPALDAPAGGAVQLQLSTAAAPAGEHGEQPSLTGLPGATGLSHLDDGFCSPGNLLASSKCQGRSRGSDAVRRPHTNFLCVLAAIPCEGTRAAAFALMTSQRDSTSPHKQQPAHHTVLHAAYNGSGSRTGVSPASGSTPSDRNTQSPADGATKGGEQPVHLAIGTAASAAQTSARGIITQMACVAEVDVSPAHSQQVSEPHKSGSERELPPTREGSADAEPAQQLGEQPPCSQGAGLNLNLSPEEAMLTGAKPPHPAAQDTSHRGPHPAVDAQPCWCRS